MPRDALLHVHHLPICGGAHQVRCIRGAAQECTWSAPQSRTSHRCGCRPLAIPRCSCRPCRPCCTHPRCRLLALLQRGSRLRLRLKLLNLPGRAQGLATEINRLGSFVATSCRLALAPARMTRALPTTKHHPAPPLPTCVLSESTVEVSQSRISALARSLGSMAERFRPSCARRRGTRCR